MTSSGLLNASMSRDRPRLFSLVDLEVRHGGNMAPSLVQHVVADAGAFLKKAPLQVSFYLRGLKPRGPHEGS